MKKNKKLFTGILTICLIIMSIIPYSFALEIAQKEQKVFPVNISQCG